MRQDRTQKPRNLTQPVQPGQAELRLDPRRAGTPPPSATAPVPDRSRLPFSNAGASVDAQGWGASIATLGYGDLQGGAAEDLSYTAELSGTSGAAAMVAGVIAALQGLPWPGRNGRRSPPVTCGAC